jgi:hypothetical protein
MSAEVDRDCPRKLALVKTARIRSIAPAFTMDDWLHRLEEYAAADQAELDLAQLSPGDVLKIGTKNTVYTLRILDDQRAAALQTNREDRPVGPVKIAGCTFGLSSTISPDHLFCGGNLELSFLRDEVRMIHTTSVIRTIAWIRHAPKQDSAQLDR